MSKYIYIVSATSEIFDNRLDQGFLDLCKAFTNKQRAVENAQKRSKESSYFPICAVYKAELLNYSWDYLEIIDAYKQGEKMNISAE